MSPAPVAPKSLKGKLEREGSWALGGGSSRADLLHGRHPSKRVLGFLGVTDQGSAQSPSLKLLIMGHVFVTWGNLKLYIYIYTYIYDIYI